jgi:hypothetical protein
MISLSQLRPPGCGTCDSHIRQALLLKRIGADGILFLGEDVLYSVGGEEVYRKQFIAYRYLGLKKMSMIASPIRSSDQHAAAMQFERIRREQSIYCTKCFPSIFGDAYELTLRNFIQPNKLSRIYLNAMKRINLIGTTTFREAAEAYCLFINELAEADALEKSLLQEEALLENELREDTL